MTFDFWMLVVFGGLSWLVAAFIVGVCFGMIAVSREDVVQPEDVFETLNRLERQCMVPR